MFKWLKNLFKKNPHCDPSYVVAIVSWKLFSQGYEGVLIGNIEEIDNKIYGKCCLVKGKVTDPSDNVVVEFEYVYSYEGRYVSGYLYYPN